MNVLFVTLYNIRNIADRGIYEDLLREFSRNGHHVFVVSPTERRNHEKTHLIKKDNTAILKVHTGNIQKTNIIEKGISTILLEKQYISATKKYLSNVKFDLVLYSTPPVTLTGMVQYIKKRDGAKTYLLLKDIFPQNAVDLGMMQTKGPKALIYNYFRKKEKKLYALSDRIGCMSQANVDYVLQNNPEIPKEKVEICPNSIEVCDLRLSEQERTAMRSKYGLPPDKKVFVYGGNLGKPQDVPFIINCLKRCAELTDVYFVIAGNGTDRYLLEKYMEVETPTHVKLFEHLPKEEYDRMIACCDVGLIFLDHRFTIPNFPSRLLSYMQAGLPVLACTDRNTDIGKVIVDGGFGWWCESNNLQDFDKTINKIIDMELTAMGQNGWIYLNNSFSIENSYKAIES